MVTLIERNMTKDLFQSTKDEFEKYLKEQRLKTTFNGIEVADFSRYRKLLLS